MSTGTENSLKGKYDEVAGKVKQSVGETFNDNEEANKGAAQEVKGHGEQAWGSVKQSASDAQARHEANTPDAGHGTAHDVRESITSTARNVKESIQNATSGSHRE